MNRLAQILPKENIRISLKATSKKRVFEQASLIFESRCKIARSKIFNSLFSREKLGSTGLGNGIAIPHVQNNQVIKPSCIVAILSEGLDFEALDNNPVDLIVFLILPELSKPANLQILAQISRLLRNSEITNKLRGCKSEESAFAIITQHLKNKAA